MAFIPILLLNVIFFAFIIAIVLGIIAVTMIVISLILGIIKKKQGKKSSIVFFSIAGGISLVLVSFIILGIVFVKFPKNPEEKVESVHWSKESITINEIEYQRGVYEINGHKLKASVSKDECESEPYIYNANNYEYTFCKIPDLLFDMYICYGGGGTHLYCATSQLEQAEEYYSKLNNYNSYCEIGKKFDGSNKIVKLEEIDTQKIVELLKFANEMYDSLEPIETDELELAFYNAETYSFYLESNDGVLETESYWFRVVDGKIYLVREKRAGKLTIYKMLVPETINEYFVDAIEKYCQ